MVPLETRGAAGEAAPIAGIGRGSPMRVPPGRAAGGAGVGAGTGAGSVSSAPENAAKKASTVGNLSSGDLESAFEIARRIGRGTWVPCGAPSIGLGASRMCCVAHSHAVLARKGISPVSIS